MECLGECGAPLTRTHRIHFHSSTHLMLRGFNEQERDTSMLQAEVWYGVVSQAVPQAV